MSGGATTPASRQPAISEPASRRTPERAAPTPARQLPPVRAPDTGRPQAPTTRERIEASFSGGPGGGSEPAWTTRARIAQHALAAPPAGAVPPGPPKRMSAPRFGEPAHAAANRIPILVADTWRPPEPGVEAVARAPPATAAIVQTKLSVTTPNDPLEREADSIAARVVRGAAARAPPTAGAPGRPLPRAADSGPEPVVTRARAPPAAGGSLPASVQTVLAAPGTGRPLDAAMRARIEPHVGVDLSGVVVRQGSEVAAAAEALHARAFTAGGTIFLAAGSSPTDLELMAHEATHVAQQQSAPEARTQLMRQADDDSFLPDLALPEISLRAAIPEFILDAVRSEARQIPGYTLLTQITGIDPLSDERIEVDREQLIEVLLTYGPFGAAVAEVLRAIDVIGDVFDVISEGLAANDLTAARLSRDVDAAWAELSFDKGIAGNLAVVERYVDALLADVRAFVAGIAGRVIEIVRAVAAEVLEPLLETPEIRPVWDLAKKVLHYDPLRGAPVEAETADILADFLRLIDEEDRLAQMQERGTLRQTAEWLDTQLGTFASLVDELGGLFAEAWAAIQPENLPNLLTDLEALAGRAFGFVIRVRDFAATVIEKVLELVKQSLLGWLSEHANAVPGFHLLTVIIGSNPFTGEEVPRTAENLIRGFITLLPSGEQTYAQLAESGVIAQAAERIESAMTSLGITWDLVTSTFRGIWDTLELDDLLDPIGAFNRIVAQFGEPLTRIVEFVRVVIEVVITLILRLMNFPSDLLGSIIAGASQAISDIQRDPVGFLINMLEAVKLGFTGFLDNILTYLMQGLVDWLFRGLRQLGITIPTDLSLQSVLNLVLQVLGVTVEMLWQKLGEHIGPERVQMIRNALDMLSGAWSFIRDVQEGGVGAIWRYVTDQLGQLWDTLLNMAREWIVETIIRNVTARLLSLLDPTGVMAVVNSFIAFFRAVQSAIEYLREILAIVNEYVQTIAQVAAGNIVPGAQKLERGLASAVPIAIGFLAAQVGLANVPEKIVEIIQRLRELVDQALDWLFEQAIRLGQAALSALGLRTATPEAESAHQALLRELVPRLREDAPTPELDDARWFASKQRQAEALIQESQPRLEPGVRLSIIVAQGQEPRQLLYEMDISPNTTATGGSTAPPTLTPGERYTFFVDKDGNDDPVSGRFLSTAVIGSQHVIWYDPGEARKTEYRMSRSGRPLGHSPTRTWRPAFRPDGTPNFRLAGVGGGENPVFRPLASRSSPYGTYAEEVEGEPLALSGYSEPREVPPGLARINPALVSAGSWVPGHLVNGEMGGPGTNNNLVPIPRATNAGMRGNYENALRRDLELGKYYYFHARVTYHPTTASTVIGRPSDFVRQIRISYQEITKAGPTWTRVGSLTTRPAYTVDLPQLAELDPTRVTG